ncbi:MAG: Sensor histidine kinase [Myxococcaceae bacterium]|nr:Sensor histidine kinase [Myxococcaceae bacterium]
MPARRALSADTRVVTAALGLCLLLLGASQQGHAYWDSESALDVRGPLRGQPLGERLEILEDPTGALGIADMSSPAVAERFKKSGAGSLSLGFTTSAYWLRIKVRNAQPESYRWLLELSYPLLDEVTLFVPQGEAGPSGQRFSARKTGDMLPFAQRDVGYRNFVFSLEEPPTSLRTYYLRVRSSGTVNLPVVAWSVREFLEHQHLDWAALCIFYGVLLVMACYSACVYLFVRQREYLPYVGYIVCVGVTQFTVAGHTFQFVLPSSPGLVHRLLPTSVAATLSIGTLLVTSYLPRGALMNKLGRLALAYCCGLCLASVVLPYQLSIRLTNRSVLVLMVIALLYGFELQRTEGKRARLFVLGWGCAIVGALVTTLQSAGWLPLTFVTDWSMQIGCTLQLVLLSSALADKLETASDELKVVHSALKQKLSDLSQVLQRSEEANQRAARATQLKDEFLATMSHELRTPLNPIINIPQEMRREFVAASCASCTHCHSRFELDEGEQLSSASSCPECSSVGSLVAESGVRYVGDATRTRKFLTKIERSGVQLMHVVNGILDFSKLQAGHLELNREPFEVGALVREVAVQFQSQARQKDLGITCMVRPPEFVLHADAQRVRQVLTILLDNAIKYSERAGYITLRAETVGDGAYPDYAFSVTDQGIGLSSEHFESIFGSFEQVYKGTTRKYGGTGLGLSIARSLARMHGGDLTVSSSLGQGSTFTFRLPTRVPAAAVSRDPSSARRSAAEASG